MVTRLSRLYIWEQHEVPKKMKTGNLNITIIKYLDSHKITGIHQKILYLEEFQWVYVMLQGLCKCFSCINFQWDNFNKMLSILLENKADAECDTDTWC